MPHALTAYRLKVSFQVVLIPKPLLPGLLQGSPTQAFDAFESAWHQQTARPCRLTRLADELEALAFAAQRRIYEFARVTVRLHPHDDVYSIIEREWPAGLLVETAMLQLEARFPQLELRPYPVILADEAFDRTAGKPHNEPLRQAMERLFRQGLHWVSPRGLPYFGYVPQPIVRSPVLARA
ncbi:MAG: hypothetical protein INF43_04865 [Alphaproteobacteria bacterium]|jgi:hypothetical protein|nr:hypothetical protein [Alphaproteobacteria bacterium]